MACGRYGFNDGIGSNEFGATIHPYGRSDSVGLLDGPLVGVVHDGFEAVDALGAMVEAGDHAVGFAAGFHEDLFSFFFDLFEGFEAVTEKGGAEDGEAFDAVARHGA